MLKSTGLLNAIRVVHTGSAVQIRTRAAPSTTFVTQASFPTTSPAVNDVLGARSAADGTVTAYKNGVAIGSINVTTTANPWPAPLNTAGGRIGVYVQGATVANFARLDDFGGGNFTPPAGTSYTPNLYEVGPTSNANYTAAKAAAGRWFTPVNSLPAVADHAIQDALDAAAASAGDDLVVVYPGPSTAATNPRLNPRGAYYENLLVNSPVKLQGVGPGGLQGTTVVPGSTLDGGAFGGDSPVAADWRDTIATMTWDGTQDINDGAVITLLARAGTFGPAFPAAIDGFDIRGGDQAGFPTNINEVGGTPTGLPPAIVTQGGAMFANAYVRNLRMTNNTVREQRRRLRHDPRRHAEPAGDRTEQSQRGPPRPQQPDHRQRRHQPRRRNRGVRRSQRLRDRRQRHLRQLLRRVRRWRERLRQLRAPTGGSTTTGSGSTAVLRRGCRDHGRRRTARRPAALSPGSGPGRRLRQPDPGQPGRTTTAAGSAS